MKKLTRVQNIEEPVYLKKDWFGYRVVHPVKNPNGSFNWINIIGGGKSNFIILIIVLVIILSFFYGVKQMMRSCNDLAENPCKYITLDCSRYYNLYSNTEQEFVLEDVNPNT